MRAIDADAIEYTHAVARNLFDGHNWNELVVTKDEIEDMPTIQPEPQIIRCKDCGHRDDHGCCKYWRGLAMSETPIATDDYDFCNHARRREREH